MEPRPEPSSSAPWQMRAWREREIHPMVASPAYANNAQQLPDLVDHLPIGRPRDGHVSVRRSASICLPIDRDTVRAVGMSLRAISEDFVRNNQV